MRQVMNKKASLLGLLLATTTVASADGLVPQHCKYPFPEYGVTLCNNIMTILPNSKLTGGECTIFSGGIDTINGFNCSCNGGGAEVPNVCFSILCKDESPFASTSSVNYFTLGGYFTFCEEDVAVHGQAKQPVRLHAISGFAPYTQLNLSGRILADVSNLDASGAKIYSDGVTFSNGLFLVGVAKQLNVEIGGQTYVCNDLVFPYGATAKHDFGIDVSLGAEGHSNDIHGALIFHAQPSDTEARMQGKPVQYFPVDYMGDVTFRKLAGGNKTADVIFLSEWNEQGRTLSEKYNLPDSDTPLLIGNSACPALWRLVDIYALDKKKGADLRPMASRYHKRFRCLTDTGIMGRVLAAVNAKCDMGTPLSLDEGKMVEDALAAHFETHHSLTDADSNAQIKSVLNIDGRVYSYLALYDEELANPLEDAFLVEGECSYSEGGMYLLTRDGVLDMRDAGESITLDNVTAGTCMHGGGKVLVEATQCISVNSHKTIRHEIDGSADMEICGKARQPINVAFERLLEPFKDTEQAQFLVKRIKADHARIYIGPGNIVGVPVPLTLPVICCNKNAELYNYGVIRNDVQICNSSRAVNSHFACTELLKYSPCCAPPVKVPADCYPGTIQGSVILKSGAEFCNYGDVLGDIEVEPKAILYGCGNCGGKVTLRSGSLMYHDYTLYDVPYFKKISTPSHVTHSDGSIKRRPGSSIGELYMESGSVLAFRIDAPEKINVSPVMTLIVRDKLTVPSQLDVRVDIGGFVVALLPKDGSFGSVRLMQVSKPKNVHGAKRFNLHITSGADLVEDAQLIWNPATGSLDLRARLSPAARGKLAAGQSGSKKSKKRKKSSRRRR